MGNEQETKVSTICRDLQAAPERERSKLLKRKVGGDVGLEQKVLTYLKMFYPETKFDQIAPLIPDSVGGHGGSMAGSRDSFNPGGLFSGTLGPYKIEGVLGKGGMGTVYRAIQEQPVKRQVALKIIEPNQDELLSRRFIAESQALARLSHPNIAALYHVGFENGRHYIAMELVEGVFITKYCDDQQLTINARIDLFFGLCSGLKHAHEKGILHRDVKPSNVLVTEVDGQPVVKVIDFGIARSMSEPLTTIPDLTMGSIVGTPAYLSPEAIRGEFDTRSDVYSAGLLLYEMLLEKLPLRDVRAPISELLDNIEKGHQVSLTKGWHGLKPQDRYRIAEARKTDPKGLSRQLSGDLDAIVRKAIYPEPAQRYASPGELESDLRRHLNHQPIEARPPSTLYLLNRFVRRNSGKVASILLIFLALIAGIVARTLEAQRANREATRAFQARDDAQNLADFLTGLFQSGNPELRGQVPTIEEVLARGVETLKEDETQTPLNRALFLSTIGEIYQRMGDHEAASGLLLESLQIYEREPGQHGTENF